MCVIFLPDGIWPGPHGPKAKRKRAHHEQERKGSGLWEEVRLRHLGDISVQVVVLVRYP